MIKGITAQGYRVGDRIVPGGLLLTPDDARDWHATDTDALVADDVALLLAMEPLPEFILLGTGAKMNRPPQAFTKAMAARGIGVEPMDSRAAARAWGLLRSEGRWIGAALLPL